MRQVCVPSFRNLDSSEILNTAAEAEVFETPVEYTVACGSLWVKMKMGFSVLRVERAKLIPRLQFWFCSHGGMDEAGVHGKLNDSGIVRDVNVQFSDQNIWWWCAFWCKDGR